MYTQLQRKRFAIN